MVVGHGGGWSWWWLVMVVVGPGGGWSWCGWSWWWLVMMVVGHGGGWSWWLFGYHVHGGRDRGCGWWWALLKENNLLNLPKLSTGTAGHTVHCLCCFFQNQFCGCKPLVVFIF